MRGRAADLHNERRASDDSRSRPGVRADRDARRPVRAGGTGSAGRPGPTCAASGSAVGNCRFAFIENRWSMYASSPPPIAPPTRGTSRPRRAKVFLPTCASSRKPIALLHDHQRRAGEALGGQVATGCRRATTMSGLAEQVVGVGSDEREQHGRADLLLDRMSWPRTLATAAVIRVAMR